MKKLNDDLQSIHNIMRKTIDDVLDRGSKLDDVSAISQNLANESKKYNWGAKQLSMLAWWKHWAPMISVVVIALIVVIYRFVL
jgi:vesicle transport protein SEC22